MVLLDHPPIDDAISLYLDEIIISLNNTNIIIMQSYLIRISFNLCKCITTICYSNLERKVGYSLYTEMLSLAYE